MPLRVVYDCSLVVTGRRLRWGEGYAEGWELGDVNALLVRSADGERRPSRSLTHIVAFVTSAPKSPLLITLIGKLETV